MKTLVAAHRAGWFLGFAGDQDARKKGVFIDFFDRPASTALGAAYFAYKMKVPLAPVFVTRLSNGKYRVEREELIPIPEDMDKNEAVEEMTRQHMARLEKRIRERPEQYWWFHRRWKTRPKMRRATPSWPGCMPIKKTLKRRYGSLKKDTAKIPTMP
jgi:KDO2-lipid IV(A) lauroyltransferase